MVIEPLAAGDWPAGRVTPQDVRETASACRRALEPVAAADWDSPAGDLEWSCRTTLGHLLSALLAGVCAAAPPEARGAHAWGMADASGFAALACDELLLHTSDIAAGLGVSFDPPRELCARVLGRLFPWAPRDQDPWEALRWANGRAPLGERPRLAPDWVAHPAPLQEWDGVDPNASS